jgi:antirestriction protein ArdC
METRLRATCDPTRALEPREDHAAYIANWLEVLQNDGRAIFTAAAHAQTAADFIHKFSASTAEKVEEPCAA